MDFLSLSLSLVTIPVIFGVVWYGLRFLKEPSLAVGLLVFFIPFERIPSLKINDFTIKLNHFLGGFLLLVWLTQVLARRRLIRPNPLILPTLAMLCALALSLIQAVELKRAVAFWLASAFALMLSLLIPQLFYRREQVKPLVLILGLTSLVTLLFGCYQFVGDLAGLPESLTGLTSAYQKAILGIPRIEAFAQEPLYLGNFLLLPINLALAYLLVPQPWLKRQTLIVFLVLAALVFGLTLSRGAYIGFVASVVVLALLLWKEFFTINNLRFLALALVVAGLLMTGVLAKLGEKATQSFTSHATSLFQGGHEESIDARVEAWQKATDLWRQSPVFGVGLGNYGPASLGYPSEPPPPGFWPIVNNEYFELLAETGVIGLICFLFYLVVLFSRSALAIRATRGDPLLRATLVGLTAALVGILVQYAFFSTFYILTIWTAVGLLVAVQSIALNHSSQKKLAA